MADDPRLDALRALADTGLRLVRQTASARIALASLHDMVDVRIAPAPWRDELAAVLRAAHAEALAPVPAGDLEKVLRDAWGARPSGEVDDLDLHTPAAVTPTSVVARGTRDDEPVAVKILRPGLAEALRADLSLVDAMALPLKAAFPRLDAAGLLREARERLLDEADLEHEASVQRTLARALRRHPSLHVPAPVTSLAAERVSVSAWVEGRDVGQVAASGTAEERATLARALVAFHVGSAREGTLHADPHPGHALLMDDGRTAFLDPGATAKVDPARVDLGVRALDALRAGDGEEFGEALEALGFLPAERGPDALAAVRAILGPFAQPGPVLLDAEAVHDLGRRAVERMREGLALAGAATLPPTDLWPARMLGSLVATVARLEVEEDWLALVRAAAADGWRS
jgi:predicted unusual protein kinase regulating ubiquinone biosynthesis (AarF/ABC1/UbiB family)